MPRGDNQSEIRGHADDDALLVELGAALAAADPMPERLVEQVKDLYTWRTVDAELAELVADTALEAMAVRSGNRMPRILTFTAGVTTLVLEVAEARERRRLLGQIVSPRPARVAVDYPGGNVTTTADDLGRFRVDDCPTGPIRVSLEFADDRERVVTSWVSV